VRVRETDIDSALLPSAGKLPEILVQGSADLIQSLHADGLIDEFNIWTFPVILGKGKRLFEPGTLAGGLEVIDSRSRPRA
jgi:dihydrofolate reductase